MKPQGLWSWSTTRGRSEGRAFPGQAVEDEGSLALLVGSAQTATTIQRRDKQTNR